MLKELFLVVLSVTIGIGGTFFLMSLSFEERISKLEERTSHYAESKTELKQNIDKNRQYIEKIEDRIWLERIEGMNREQFRTYVLYMSEKKRIKKDMFVESVDKPSSYKLFLENFRQFFSQEEQNNIASAIIR